MEAPVPREVGTNALSESVRSPKRYCSSPADLPCASAWGAPSAEKLDDASLRPVSRNATPRSFHCPDLGRHGEKRLTLHQAGKPTEGKRSRSETDQYYIALLGLELLTGKPPVTVTCYADLDKKKVFFDAPLATFEQHRRKAPALFFVLKRMLEVHLEGRWKKMSGARNTLGKLQGEWFRKN
jgi:hypothetical protein